MNQTAQNAKGSDVAPLSVKKSKLSPGLDGLKTERHAWVMPTQHHEVDANPGTPDKGAFIFKK